MRRKTHNAHHIARLLLRQVVGAGRDSIVETHQHGGNTPRTEIFLSLHFTKRVFCLASTESSNGNPRCIPRRHLLSALGSHLKIEATLDDAKQVLPLWVFVSDNAAIEPSYRALHRLLHSGLVWRSGLYDIVKLHDNIRANAVLEGNGVLRSEEPARNVFVRLVK